MLLHGNAYVQILRDAEGDVAELFALRPERVTMELDASGWPAAYLYRAGGRVTTLPVDPVKPSVVHLKSCHPLDDHYGLGCLGAAAAPSRSTMRPPPGTGRCSTMRRGLRGLWSMIRATDRR